MLQSLAPDGKRANRGGRRPARATSFPVSATRRSRVSWALHDGRSHCVLVTHSPDVAAQADRRIRLKDGVVIEAEPTHDAGAERCRRNHRGRSRRPRITTTPPGSASILRARDLLRDAGASVTSRVGRTVGLVAAVAVGVALTVATFGISSSANAQVADTFNAHTDRECRWNGRATPWRPNLRPAQGSIVERLAALSGTEAAGMISDFTQRTIQLAPSRDSVKSASTASPPIFQFCSG